MPSWKSRSREEHHLRLRPQRRPIPDGPRRSSTSSPIQRRHARSPPAPVLATVCTRKHSRSQAVRATDSSGLGFSTAFVRRQGRMLVTVWLSSPTRARSRRSSGSFAVGPHRRARLTAPIRSPRPRSSGAMRAERRRHVQLLKLVLRSAATRRMTRDQRAPGIVPCRRCRASSDSTARW